MATEKVIYEKIETEEKSPIKIIEICIPGGTDYTYFPKHWHRSIEIILPKTNGMELWIEGKTEFIYPEEAYIINSREIHGCSSIHPTELYEGYAIQLRYTFIKDCFDQIDDCRFIEKINLHQESAFKQLLKEIILTSRQEGPYEKYKVTSLTYALLYELLTSYQQSHAQVVTHPSKIKKRLVEVLDYLDAHASENFNALQIAEHFHWSYGYLAKIFKQELNMTMKDYINSVRTRNASFDLLSTDDSVVDIALRHGFVSSKAFYKEFDKIYHMTPKEYRKDKKTEQIR